MRQCAIADSGNDSDLTTTEDSPYFHENSSDESVSKWTTSSLTLKNVTCYMFTCKLIE